jgi:hypothetical protein
MMSKFFSIVFLLIFCLSSCKKDDSPPREITLPEVNTVKVFATEQWNNIFYSRFVYVGVGNVISAGGSDSTFRGICYSQVTQVPTKLDSVSMAGKGEGTFECLLNLKKGRVKYYTRAFAENKAGISYGQAITHFTECFDNYDSFYLIGGYLRTEDPRSGQTDIPLTVTLKWGGMFDGYLYDIYLDQNSTPTTLIASNLAIKSLEVRSLSYSTTYYWKVVMRFPGLSCAMWSTPVSKFSTIPG